MRARIGGFPRISAEAGPEVLAPRRLAAPAIAASLLLALLACSHDSPTAPSGPTIYGQWLGTQSISIPECGVAFAYEVPMTVSPGDDAGVVSVHADFPGLGSCGLFGSSTPATLDVSSYGCFRFGYECEGHPVTCEDGRALSVCDAAIWSTLRATLRETAGEGVARLRVPVVDPDDGTVQSELVVDAAVAFRRAAGGP